MLRLSSLPSCRSKLFLRQRIALLLLLKRSLCSPHTCSKSDRSCHTSSKQLTTKHCYSYPWPKQSLSFPCACPFPLHLPFKVPKTLQCRHLPYPFPIFLFNFVFPFFPLPFPRKPMPIGAGPPACELELAQVNMSLERKYSTVVSRVCWYVVKVLAFNRRCCCKAPEVLFSKVATNTRLAAPHLCAFRTWRNTFPSVTIMFKCRRVWT